jgi:adenylosuccinate lyase
MIRRYTRPEMASIWELQTRFKIWFEIEAHAADVRLCADCVEEVAFWSGVILRRGKP